MSVVISNSDTVAVSRISQNLKASADRAYRSWRVASKAAAIAPSKAAKAAKAAEAARAWARWTAVDDARLKFKRAIETVDEVFDQEE